MSRASDRMDYQLARRLAEAIGLADHPPLHRPDTPFICNRPQRRQHRRRLNYSDLLPYSRSLAARHIQQHAKSPTPPTPPPNSARKNACRDLFIAIPSAETDPIVNAKAQQSIAKQDQLRRFRQLQETQRLRRASQEKQKRSSILWEVSEGLPERSKGEWRSQSFSKLEASLQCSQFNLVHRQGQLLLRTRQDDRRSRTAQSSRPVPARFNHNDRCELRLA